VSALHPGWTTYTTDDGLVSNMVHAMTVAPDGTLWFSTVGGGVSHFDGETWTNYTTADGLANDNVSSIAVTPDGTLWFGTTGGGVFRFDGKTWTTYTTEDGLLSDTITAIALTPDGGLWCTNPHVMVGPDTTTQGGISHFDGETWSAYSFEEMGVAEVGDYGVLSLAVGPDDALWAGTDASGVFRYDGETWTNYTEEDGLAGKLVASIAVTPDGALWFGTDGGLCRYLPPD
jgi:ligand-binding sensor domain-containing protein